MGIAPQVGGLISTKDTKVEVRVTGKQREMEQAPFVLLYVISFSQPSSSIRTDVIPYLIIEETAKQRDGVFCLLNGEDSV